MGRGPAARLIAGALVAIGASGLVATHAAWVPCSEDQSANSCLSVMDQPPHVWPLQLLWLAAIALSLAGGFLLDRGISWRIAGLGTVLVLIMSYPVEYIVWSTVAGGHWDVAPGTGYTQSAAIVLAGVLIAVGSAIEIPSSGRAGSSPRRREPAPAEG